MRNILFRGKHIHALSCNEHLDGTWVYGYYIGDGYILTEDGEMLVDKDSVGQMTDSNDINGNSIWEGDLVNQKSVLFDDEDVDFTGYVAFIEGRWMIDNGEEAIPLWSEHRENRVMGE